jgi:hypothetical protein
MIVSPKETFPPRVRANDSRTVHCLLSSTSTALIAPDVDRITGPVVHNRNVWHYHCVIDFEIAETEAIARQAINDIVDLHVAIRRKLVLSAACFI